MFGLEDLVNKLIIQEFNDQGHHLTGTFAESLDGKITSVSNSTTLAGYAVAYAKTLEEGLKAEEIDWKMYGPLIKYFQARGFDESNSKRFAALTIKRWLLEGLPTQGSSQYSKTGERTGFINKALSNSIDIAVQEKYLETKSETI
jgi:hypothetical protein